MIIRTTKGAQNVLLGLESMDAAELDELRKLYEQLSEKRGRVQSLKRKRASLRSKGNQVKRHRAISKRKLGFLILRSVVERRPIQRLLVCGDCRHMN